MLAPALPILLAIARPARARPQLVAVTESDADLVARARRGDERATEAIYRRHVDRVAGIAARILRSRVEAEDITQETFIAVLGHLDALEDGDALRGYLAQTAVRACQKRLRRRRILTFLSLDAGEQDWTLDAVAASSTSAEVRAELALLDRTLLELPADVRIAWTLRRVEDLPLEDVAHACGCSLATAKRRVAAGDAHVQRHVAFDLAPAASDTHDESEAS